MSLQAATLPLLLPCHPAKGMLLLPYAGYTSVKRRPRVCSSRGHIFYQQLPGGARHDGDQRVLSADGLHSTATRQGGRGPGRGAQHGVHLGQVVVGCTPHHHAPGQDLPEVQFSSFGWP